MPSIATARFVITRDSKGHWYWILQSRNFRTLATSSVGYTTKEKCLIALESVAEAAGSAPVWNAESDVWEVAKSWQRLWPSHRGGLD